MYLDVIIQYLILTIQYLPHIPCTYISTSLGLICDGIKVTHNKGHQIGAHLDTLLELVQHQATGGGGGCQWHVEQCFKVFVSHNGQGKFSLHSRFIKTWECLSSGSGLKLRGGKISRKLQ